MIVNIGVEYGCYGYWMQSGEGCEKMKGMHRHFFLVYSLKGWKGAGRQ